MKLLLYELGVIFGVLILVTSPISAQKDKIDLTNNTGPMTTYANYGVTISFEGSFQIVNNNADAQKDYFHQAIEIIHFNENKSKNPNGQHLLSEFMPPQELLELNEVQLDTTLSGSSNNQQDDLSPDIAERVVKTETATSLSNSFSYYSYLSSLFIMPQLSIKELKQEIEPYIKRNPSFQIAGKIEKIKIGNKKVLKWRAQWAKTRLDHYVVFGKTYNYLFVSSPYGANGAIENVIVEMKLR